jgi:hypothetical protein
MKRGTILGGAFATVLVLFGLVAAYRSLRQDDRPAAKATAAEEAHPSFLYGRITTIDGAIREGRLRWGGSQEAFWGDYFNGRKKENHWVSHVPPERLPTKRHPIAIFGLEIGQRERSVDLDRLFMARFGDIARIEAHGRDVRVTLKSGAAFDLNRSEASDFDDGVRVWDRTRGMVDFDSLRVRMIELLPGPTGGGPPDRLHGTVRTPQGEFTGFVQWDREHSVGADELDGHTSEGELSLRFDTIRSIARRSRGSSLVTLRDGREIVLSGTRGAGDGNRGAYVDDPRYGRVLVSWDAFERVEFSAGGSGPAYSDFPPGGPLRGSVTTRDGRRLTGRLVYDLDESEITETLDAPARGVDYTVPFGLIASVALPNAEEDSAEITLHSGERLLLERTGDLGKDNAGMLVFIEGSQRPEYIRWRDVSHIDLERPTAMYPPVTPR